VKNVSDGKFILNNISISSKSIILPQQHTVKTESRIHDQLHF